MGLVVLFMIYTDGCLLMIFLIGFGGRLARILDDQGYYIIWERGLFLGDGWYVCPVLDRRVK